MDPNLKLSTADAPQTAQDFAYMHDKPYCKTVGSLQYVSVGTRLDITNVCSTLSRYLENPGLVHWHAVKHVFRYLAGTADLALGFGKDEKDLEGYTNVDGSMHED